MVALVLPLSFHDPRFWALNAVASSLYRCSSTPSSSVVKTFLALPSYSRSSVIFQPPFQLFYTSKNRAEVAQRVCGVEERIQIIAQPFAYVVVCAQQLPEAGLTLPGPHSGVLDHTVGVLAVHAALHEREQDAAREDDTSSAVQVLEHAVFVYFETS